MSRFKTGDFVVATNRASLRFIGKVGVVTEIDSITDPRVTGHTVRFLQPTDRGERTGVFFADELVLLTDTKLDKIPYNIVP